MNDNKSTFVTVIAWLFIVGSGLATLFSVMQNIVFLMIMKEEYAQLADSKPNEIPFFLENLQLDLLAFLLVSLTLFFSSIGLLKRKSWARLVFIVLLLLGIVAIIGHLISQAMFLSTTPETPQEQEAKEFLIIIYWYIALIEIGMAGLFAWIIKRLLSEPVKQEFIA